MRHTQIDAMILGCTHYPLLRSKIRDYLGEEIKIVNPAYETAMDLTPDGASFATYKFTNRLPFSKIFLDAGTVLG